MHITPAYFLDRRVDVVLVGCGGNGSQMLTGLARLNHALTALGHPGLRVTAFDGDTVSEANIGRQMFSPADVGQFKSVVLIHRLNAFFGLDWIARPVPAGPQELVHAGPGITIMCVDSAAARAKLAPITARSTTYSVVIDRFSYCSISAATRACSVLMCSSVTTDMKALRFLNRMSE